MLSRFDRSAMSSFLHSLPASELDDLMQLVKQTQSHADQQPERAQQQRRWADQRAIAPASALSFLPPPDLAGTDWSPTRDCPTTVQPQQLDYLSGLAQQRDSGRRRPQTESNSPPVSSIPAAVSASQPHHSRGSKHQRRPPPADTDDAASNAAVAASSVAAVPAPSAGVVHPYCTVPAHLESVGLDAVSSLNPDAEDARGLKALDSAWEQVCTNTANIAESRKELDTLKSSVVQAKIDEVRARVAEEKENELDRAIARRRNSSANSQLSPKAFASTRNRKEQVISPHLLRMQRLQQQRQQQQSTRDLSSSPARDSCSSLAVDPLAPDVLHELTSELVQLQRKYASLSDQHAETLSRFESELATTREASKRSEAKLRAHFNARLKTQEQHHAQKLEAAIKSSAHEVDFLRAQVAQLQRGQSQARDLLQSWMIERQTKDRRTRTEQALLDLLCQPALVLDPTQPPPSFPLALQNLPPAACVEPAGPHASSTPSAQQPPIPAFASTLLKELPSSVLPYSVTNDELSKLRVALHKAREELRASRAHEETSKAVFQELVLTHKKFKFESNQARLRMQAQLLGCVRRLKWSADEKARLDCALKEQATYTAAVEAKLISATKRILHFQECAARARSRREDNLAQQALAKAQRREAKSLVLDAELEERVWAGGLGRVTSPHLANRLHGDRADSRNNNDAMPAASAAPPTRSSFAFGQPLGSSHERSETHHSHHSLPGSPTPSPTAAGAVVARPRPVASANPASGAAPVSLLASPASRETDRWIHELESEVEAMAVHLESNHGIRRSPSPAHAHAQPTRPGSATPAVANLPEGVARPNAPATALAQKPASATAAAPAPAPAPARPVQSAPSAADSSARASGHATFAPDASDSSVSSEVLSGDSADDESDYEFELDDEQFGRATAEPADEHQDASAADVSGASHSSLKEQLAELSVRMRLADQQVAEAKRRREAAAATGRGK